MPNTVRTMIPAPAGWTVHYALTTGPTQTTVMSAPMAGWAHRPVPGKSGEYPAAVWSLEDGTLAFCEDYLTDIVVTGPGQELRREQSDRLAGQEYQRARGAA